MSDTNRVAVGIVEEVTQGTTPATPAWKGLRITSAPDLAVNPETVVSDEIAADGNVSDLPLVGISAGGSLNHEVSFEALDLIYEGAMRNAWVDNSTRKGTGQITDITLTNNVNMTDTNDTYQQGDIVLMSGWPTAGNNGNFVLEATTDNDTLVITGLSNETAVAATQVRRIGHQGTAGDIDAVAGGTNGLTSTTLDFTTLGLAVGEWIKIGGVGASFRFATEANNGYCRISAIAANALDFDIVPTGWATEANTTETIKLWFGSRVTNGITKKFYSIEEQFQDQAPTYQYFRGQMVDGLTLSLNAKAIVTAEATFLGLSGEITETRFAGSTDEAAPTNDVLNTSSNVGQILENGVAISGSNYVLANTISIANNLREQPAIGTLGAVGIGQGEFTLTGTLNTYFDDKTMVEKVINNTESAYNIVLADGANHSMLVDIPRLKFSSGFPEVPGKNEDTTVNLGFQGIKHATLGYSMLMQRFFYVEA